MTIEKKLEYARVALDCLESDQLDLIVNMIRTMRPNLYDYHVVNRFIPFNNGYHPFCTVSSLSSYSLKSKDTIVGIMLDYVRAIDHDRGGSIISSPNIIITTNRWLSFIQDTQCFVDNGYYLDKKSVPVLECAKDDPIDGKLYMIMTPAGFINQKKDLVIKNSLLVSIILNTNDPTKSLLSASISRIRYDEDGMNSCNVVDPCRFSDGLELKDISVSFLIRSPKNVKLLDDPREWN